MRDRGAIAASSESWEAIHLVSRGVAIFRVSVRGTQMHSSLSDELEGVNASLEMAELMVRMARKAPGILRYVPHSLSGGADLQRRALVRAGSATAIYPGHAEFLCDVRALPGMTAEQIEADVRAFLAGGEAENPPCRPGSRC